MDSLIGSRIGVYEIDARLGAGGMGVVYRARDTRLGRHVAIKVLAPNVSADPERVARLIREARVLAALKHPGIATIHSLEDRDGVYGLVMELVEGETLSARLEQGGIPTPKALSIARQIAAALEAAHDAGIIHRDLKPANVMINDADEIKILDFGLAKMAAAEAPAANASTFAGTEIGQIVGTPGYMSPEQARGLAVDRHTDVWAFGCVLFELLSARPAFQGATKSDAMAAVLKDEPDWTCLPEAVPASIRELLARCLRKDPAQRLRDIRDARLQLDAVPQDTSTTTIGFKRWGLLGVCAAVVAVVMALLFWQRVGVSRAVAEAPEQLTSFSGSVGLPSLSQDGRLVTFVSDVPFGGSAGSGQIYIKALPGGEAMPLTNQPFSKDSPVFSPDGSRVVYTGLMPKLQWDSWQVPAAGGAPSLFLPNAAAVRWLDPQRLLYSSIKTGSHMGVVTSTPTRADARDVYFPASHAGMVHRTAPSPDGKWTLAVEMDAGTWLPCRLMPIDGSSEGRSIGPRDGGCTSAAWSPDGRWMFLSSNAGGEYHLWRQRFPDGTPEQISFGPMEQEGTAVTPDGRHIITSMGLTGSSIWVHDGRGDRALTAEGFAMWPAVLPSRRRVMYLKRTSNFGALAAGELWSADLDSGAPEAVLPGTIVTSFAVSSREDRVLYTAAPQPGTGGIWIADLDRRSAPRQLTSGGESRAFFGAPGEIVFMSGGVEHRLFRMHEDGSAIEPISTAPITYLVAVSRDGHWAAVVSPEGAGRIGSRLELRSLIGDESVQVCNDRCAIGPRTFRNGGLGWTHDGARLFIAMWLLGVESTRTLVLPYYGNAKLRDQWPQGLATARDALANPGAAVVDGASAIGLDGDSYVYARLATQSNLFRLRIPE